MLDASTLPRLQAALEIFQSCDKERKGYLTWEHGEVYLFISKALT